MDVRIAIPEDAEAMHRIIQTLVVDRTSGSKSGFVEYPVPTTDEYSERIMLSDLIHVAEDGRVVGFIAAYTDCVMDILKWNEPVGGHVLATKERPFIYVDELAVDKAYQGRGLGTRLISELIKCAKDSGYPRLYCATAHSPWKNRWTTTYLARIGAEMLEEMQNESGLTFGIYQI